jgi:hypothetical protein
MPQLSRCCCAASVTLSQLLPPSCHPAILLGFRRFPLPAAAVLPLLSPSTALATPPLVCLCRAGSAALLLYCRSAAAALPLTLLCCCCAAAAALPPCRRLCAAAAALLQTLPLPCCLRCHCSAATSNDNVLLLCCCNHVLMLCAEHVSHSHLSNLPIYLFCAADSRTIQNQNFKCPPTPPYSHCVVHHGSTPPPDRHPLLPGQPSRRLPTRKPTLFLLFV